MRLVVVMVVAVAAFGALGTGPAYGQTQEPCLVPPCPTPEGVYLPSTTVPPPPVPVDVEISPPQFGPPADDEPLAAKRRASDGSRLTLLIGGGMVLALIRTVTRRQEAAS